MSRSCHILSESGTYFFYRLISDHDSVSVHTVAFSRSHEREKNRQQFWKWQPQSGVPVHHDGAQGCPRLRPQPQVRWRRWGRPTAGCDAVRPFLGVTRQVLPIIIYHKHCGKALGEKLPLVCTGTGRTAQQCLTCLSACPICTCFTDCWEWSRGEQSSTRCVRRWLTTRMGLMAQRKNPLYSYVSLSKCETLRSGQ